jgi:hypothetical protein
VTGVKLAPCALVLVMGCSSSGASQAPLVPPVGSDASTRQDASQPDASASDASVLPDAAASCAIDASGPLLGFVGEVVAAMRTGAPVGSNDLVIPAPSVTSAFAAQVVQILGGEEGASCGLPSPYHLLRLSDPSAGTLRVIAETSAGGSPAPSLFWGTYAAPVTTPSPARSLVVEAPHPIFDTNTEIQSAAVFLASGAQMLFIAGAHRCTDTDASACSGTTDACGATAPYRISDAAHTAELPFFAVHALVSQSFSGTFLQLHGNAEPCPTALVSDCSGSWSDAGPAAALAGALTSGGVAVGQCGAGFPTATCDLCGTDNVEARMTAGSTEACTTLGSSYGRFVHVEQQLPLRLDPDGGVGGYSPLISAVLAAFPPI